MINRFKDIYDRLSDEKSKEIFEKRLIYSLTGEESYLQVLGNQYEKDVLESSEWRTFYGLLKSCGEKVALYSAGYWGRELIRHTKEIAWKYVVDKNPGGKEFQGISLISTDEFIEIAGDYKVVISSRVYYEEIRDELIQKGIPSENIIDGAILFDMSEGKQYFDLQELPHNTNGEVFADVGCYDGLSAYFFDRWCGGNGFSYCFEPDATNISRIHRILKNKDVSKYELIDKGVWSCGGRLGFVSTGNSVSHIPDNNERADSGDSIEVVALDDVLLDKGVTFIKMDIEGAELEALKGANRIITENKPKLAICVYHKPQDIWEIPELILKYNPEYRFYIRHYSYKDNETVLYAF
ncbi:FkbM family methyltransferase [Butyrivibrio sp. INlla21]|uniref:FkbM family methyltransferase n=1 Tax=Butyrivibrio sp. INlla21 TaxID=1520811 RepID=UPI0015A64AB1|nr:FkbM family methyltransferase [Butyrivibrio sp. INlla21]